MVGRRWRDNHRFQTLPGISRCSHFLSRRPATVDTDTVSDADRISMLIGLNLPADYEYQRTGAAFFLKDIHDLELAGYPVTCVSWAEEPPVAASVQTVAVEGQRDVEVGLLASAEISDGRSYVLPGRQWRAEQAFKAASFSHSFIYV